MKIERIDSAIDNHSHRLLIRAIANCPKYPHKTLVVDADSFENWRWLARGYRPYMPLTIDVLRSAIEAELVGISCKTDTGIARVFLRPKAFAMLAV